MQTLIRTVALAALLAAPTAPAVANDGQFKTKLEGRYKDMKAAMAARDADAVASLLAPDFVSEDTGGKKETRDEMLRELAAIPEDPNRSSETTLISVEGSKDTAVVVQRYHMTTKKTKPDGSIQDVDLVTTSRDVWQLISGLWLLKTTVTEQMDYKINGALAAHKEHGPST